MSTYIEFRECGTSDSGLTQRWEVVRRDSGTLLGRIQWFGAWRKYCFSPCYPTTFDASCLQDIATFCEGHTNIHKAKKI